MDTHFTLLAILGGLLMLNPLVRNLMDRVNVPVPVGYMAMGILLSVINLQWNFIDSRFEAVFAVIAELGVVALLFRVGLRSQLQALLAKLPAASLIWIGDVIASFSAGFLVAYYPLGLSLSTALVVATAISATSVAVSVSVWDELKLLQSDAGNLLIDAAELDDLSTILILTILMAVIPLLISGNGGVMEAAGMVALATFTKLLIFAALCFVFSNFAEQQFTRFNRRIGEDSTALVITITGAALAIAALAGLLGFSLAIGALFAGLAFSRDPEIVHNEGKFGDFYEFFTPFFFIHIGMQVEPVAFMAGLDTGLILFIAAVVGKLAGIVLPALLLLDKRDALILGLSMIPRAEITLLVVYQCSRLGEDVVPKDIFAAMLVVCVLTSMVAPPLVRAQLLQRQGNAS